MANKWATCGSGGGVLQLLRLLFLVAFTYDDTCRLKLERSLYETAAACSTAITQTPFADDQQAQFVAGQDIFQDD